MMREDGYKKRNPMPAEDIEWITATDEQKPMLIVKALLARKPGFFDNERTAWQGASTEPERMDLAKAALKTCERLEIFDIYDTMLYFWMSNFWGIYFHEDMRWGYNIAMMQDFSVPAPTRIKKLYKQCETIYEKAYINVNEEGGPFKSAGLRFIKIDIPASLPIEVNSPPNLVENFYRVL